MRAVDAHVLVRLITRDDDAQTLAAERFVAPGAWVSVLVLADATRVLANVYSLKRKQISLAIEMLLAHEQLVIQDADVVSNALQDFRRASTVGFSDCLVLALATARSGIGGYPADIRPTSTSSECPGNTVAATSAAKNSPP